MKTISGKAAVRNPRSMSTPITPNGFDCTEEAERILSDCLRRLGAQSASLFLADSRSAGLNLVKAIDPRENRHLGRTIKMGEGISGYVAQKRKPLLVSDFSQVEGLVSRRHKYPVDTFMSCPVLDGQSLLAVVNVAGRENGQPFAESDLSKFQEILNKYLDAMKQMVVCWHAFGSSAFLVAPPDEDRRKTNRIERQLQELKNYNASILQCLSQYVLIFDHKLNITYCSKEEDFIRLFGLNKNLDITEQSVLDLPFDVERDRLKQRIEDLLLGGSPFSLNDVKLKNCAEYRIVNMFFSPFSSIGGELLGGLLLVDDNTKHHEMRERLAEAEKLSLIGSLTSMITHEVNNPLDGVIRLINLSLAQIKEDDPVKEYLTEAQKGLQRIASLVRSLLSFSRKSVSLEAEYSSLNAIIDNAISIAQNRNAGKDISFHLKLADVSPTVRTNDFYQVITNLLTNSSDAVNSESGNISVETRVGNGELSIVVEDDGHGIPKKVQARMFDAFWTTKEYGKGTGLGLAILKKIVDKYQGKITVDSTENIGTKIYLTFPTSKLVI